MQGYFVWAKLIEALADLGYDANNIVRAPLYPMMGTVSGSSLTYWCGRVEITYQITWTPRW